MANGLQQHAALQQIQGGHFIFNSLYSYMNTRNDGLRNLIDGIFDNGCSWNPALSAFRRTLHEISSLVRKREPVRDDVIVGIGIARSFMKGLVSAVSITAEAPFLRVRILLQSQQELIKCGRLSKPYLGISDCFVRIIKNEGVFSLWRGNSVSLVRIFPEQALKLLYGYAIDRIGVDLRKHRVGYEAWLTTFVTQTCFYTSLYPLTYARTRLASDIKCAKNGGERQFHGLLDVYRKTLKSDGFVGIYRGFYIGLIGVAADSVHMLASRGPRSKTFLVDDSVLIGVLGILVVYPCETVQRRMMITSGEASKYKSSSEAIVQIIKNEGFLSLYKGFGAFLLALIPLYFVATGFNKLRNKPFGTISVVIETK